MLQKRRRSLCLFVIVFLLSLNVLMPSLLSVQIVNGSGSDTVYWDGKILNAVGKGNVFAYVETKDRLSSELQGKDCLLECWVVEFDRSPFFVRFSFSMGIADSEGSLRMKNSVDCFWLYVSKTLVDEFVAGGGVMSSPLNYSTVENGLGAWYRMPVMLDKYGMAKACFSEYKDPEVGISGFGWGSKESVGFTSRAMIVNKTKESRGSLVFEFSHPSGDDSGQVVSFNKEYLKSKGINTPVFEWGEQNPWMRISYWENKTHYFICPEHFSSIGVHEASVGVADGGIFFNAETNDTNDEVWVYHGDIDDSTPNPGTGEWMAHYSSSKDEVWQTFPNVNMSLISQIAITQMSSSDYSRADYNMKLEYTNGTSIASVSHYMYNNYQSWLKWRGRDFSVPAVVEPGTTYQLHWKNTDGSENNYVGYDASGSAYSDGTGIIENVDNDCSVWFKVLGWKKQFNTSRSSGAGSETNLVDFTSDFYYRDESGVLLMRVPVSDDVTSILRVFDNQSDVDWTSSHTLGGVNNSSYYWDAASQFVYIGMDNVSDGERVNFQINCSKASSFSISPPRYLHTGQAFSCRGVIKDADGDPVPGYLANTSIIAGDGSCLACAEWNCTGGNYECEIATTGIAPGEYQWKITYTDLNSGISFSRGDELYIGYDVGSGVYSDAVLYIRYYNTNQGLGLPLETLKFYAEGIRQPDLDYYTTTGEEINVTIKDYYNSTLYSSNHTIEAIHTYLDLGLTFHEYDFSNLDDECYIIGFLKQGASRWFELPVGANGHEEFLLPTGNYTIRVTDRNQTVLLSFNETVNSSRGYVIEGNNLQLVIEGLSVVEGQILELRREIDYALLPDTVYMDYNPITIFSVFDRIGMMLGENVWRVCPPLNVIATSVNESYGDFVSFVPLIPSNGTTENGSVSIVEDTLYLSGSSSWVNITYGNGSVIQNTSYVPAKVDLLGGTINVSSESSIFVRRETTFSSVTKFYYDVTNSTHNTGHIDGRAGFHTATVQVKNTLDVAVDPVYVYVGFANDSSPDLSTVRVFDVENGHVVDGDNDYKATGAIEFKISGGLSAGESRSFTCSYYPLASESMYSYVEGFKELRSYLPDQLFNGEYYCYSDFIWFNHGELTRRAGIMVGLNFNIDVDPDSICVYDVDNDVLLNPGGGSNDKVICDDNYVQISYSVVGDVGPGGGRKFALYFREDYSVGGGLGENNDIYLSSPLFVLFGTVPVTPYLLMLVAGFVLIVVGAIAFLLRKKKEEIGSCAALVALGIIILFITIILSAKGV